MQSVRAVATETTLSLSKLGAVPAASGPHADLALFSQTYRCKQGKHKAEPHRNTRTHTLYICLPLVAMPLSPTKPSRTALELFQASQMTHVTHGDKAPGKASSLY